MGTDVHDSTIVQQLLANMYRHPVAGGGAEGEDGKFNQRPIEDFHEDLFEEPIKFGGDREPLLMW